MFEKLVFKNFFRNRTINFDSIKPELNGFINKKMRQRSCNILFSTATVDDKKAFIFVLCGTNLAVVIRWLSAY